MTLAMPRETLEYAVEAARITPLVTDPVGGTTTYAGSSIRVPGIQDVTITPNANVKELMGDNTILDRRSKINYGEVKFKFAKFSFDLMPVIQGGVVTASGSDPNQVLTYDWSFESGQYFKLEAQAQGTDISTGDAHLTIWKMNVLTPPTIAFQNEDYTIYEVTGACYKRLSDGKAVTKTLNQTITAVA